MLRKADKDCVNLAVELQKVSESMADAAAEGRWEDVTLELWRRADLLDGLSRGTDQQALRQAFQAGEQVRLALRRAQAELTTEVQNLRASRRCAGSWRPYREPSGGTVDVSS